MKPLVVDGIELPSGMPTFVAGRKMRSGELELHPDEYPWLKQIFAWADDAVPSTKSPVGFWSRDRRTSQLQLRSALVNAVTTRCRAAKL